MQLPLFSLHARLMCSTVLSEFTLWMFAIDFFFVVNNRLPFNKQWVTVAHNRSCVENMEVVGGGMGLFYFFSHPGEAQKPDWSEMEDVKQSTALEVREDGWKRKAVCF